MTDSITPSPADRTQLQQIIAGLPEGVIIINPDEAIAWANEAALAMHGARSVRDLGETVADYHTRFAFHYRGRQPLAPGEYPMNRLIAGESFSEVIVEVSRPENGKRHGVQRIRSLLLTGPGARTECLALIIDDETERF